MIMIERKGAPFWKTTAWYARELTMSGEYLRRLVRSGELVSRPRGLTYHEVDLSSMIDWLNDLPETLFQPGVGPDTRLRREHLQKRLIEAIRLQWSSGWVLSYCP
jgi:hypothetical protein